MLKLRRIEINFYDISNFKRPEINIKKYFSYWKLYGFRTVYLNFSKRPQKEKINYYSKPGD